MKLDRPTCRVRDLNITFPRANGDTLRAVSELNFDLRKGECLGVVGESGSGKSMLCLALMGLVPDPGRCSGTIRMSDINILSATRSELKAVRRRHVGFVMQDPTSSLNPLRRIGSQMLEAAWLGGVPKAERAARVSLELEAVGLDPLVVARSYPFELSGGMLQRVVIATVLVKSPDILLADEPTTALDLESQGNVLELFAELRAQRDMSIVLVSHDIQVVSSIADRVLVLYAGRQVECCAVADLESNSRHPYTQGLVNAVPTLLTPRDQRLATIPGQLKQFSKDYAGCPFEPRCSIPVTSCEQTFPKRLRVGHDHDVWCTEISNRFPESRLGSQ